MMNIPLSITSQAVTRTYEQDITQRVTDSVASSSPSDYFWIPIAQRVVQEALKPIEGSREFVIGAFVHLEHDGLHVYVVDKLDGYNHDFAMALGLLEVDLSRELRSAFRGITVHTVPAGGLRDEELAHYRSGVNLF